jgi:hypothetical protein
MVDYVTLGRRALCCFLLALDVDFIATHQVDRSLQKHCQNS